ELLAFDVELGRAELRLRQPGLRSVRQCTACRQVSLRVVALAPVARTIISCGQLRVDVRAVQVTKPKTVSDRAADLVVRRQRLMQQLARLCELRDPAFRDARMLRIRG